MSALGVNAIFAPSYCKVGGGDMRRIKLRENLPDALGQDRPRVSNRGNMAEKSLP